MPDRSLRCERLRTPRYLVSRVFPESRPFPARGEATSLACYALEYRTGGYVPEHLARKPTQDVQAEGNLFRRRVEE
jgi:hypothetical protein